jgi:iron complex outermembrane receptor protein
MVSYAQNGTLKGTLYDAEDKDVVVGGYIILKSDQSIGASSSYDGTYSISLPAGKHNVLYKFTGKRTDTITVEIFAGKTTIQNVTFQKFSNVIETVEVRVGKFDKPIEEQVVSMEVIKPETLEKKNTRSIEQALDATPGLNILDGEPQIRGGSGFTFGVGSKVAVIVDDMPMLSGDAGRPEWGFVPVENIAQIEVIKGASSVLSGASALSGSIHIRTAYPKKEPLTKLTLYSGMYSHPNDEAGQWRTNVPWIAGTNFLHSRQAGNWDITLGANVNYDAGYTGPPSIDGPEVQNYLQTNPLSATDSSNLGLNFTNAQMASYRARINFNIRHRNPKVKGLTYGVNGNVMFAHSSLAFAWLDDTTGIYKGYPGATFLQDQFIFHVDPFITYQSNTAGKHQFKARVLRSDNKMTGNQDNESTVYYGMYQFLKSREFKRTKFDLIAGLSSQFTESFSNLYSGAGNPNNNLLNVSAYGEFNFNFWKVLTLSLGGRIEYFNLNLDSNTDKIAPIFRGGLSVKVGQESHIRASFGMGYRFPTITERFIQTGIGDFKVFPNPEINPEKSWNAEIGFRQGFKFGNFFGYLDIAAFMQRYKNTIEYLFGFWQDPADVEPGSSAIPVGFKFVNTGESQVLGIDASLMGQAFIGKLDTINKVSSGGKLTYLIGYNYIAPKVLNPDHVYATDYNPTPDANNELSYNSTSLNGDKGYLKYRFLHNVKGDLEYSIKGFAIGYSCKYFSPIENLDVAIKDFEEATTFASGVPNLYYMDYFYAENDGVFISDARVSYNWHHHTFAVIVANLTNKRYSLRPLKVESPRTIMFQYTLKLDGKEYKKRAPRVKKNA